MVYTFLLSLSLASAVLLAAAGVDIAWEPCFLSSTENNAPLPMISECTNFSVPFNYSEPSGPSFSLFVKRTRSPGAQRALFIIPGGPGESGARADALVPIFLPATGLVTVPYDIYQIDHRGTGRSNRIFCMSDAEDRAASCITELQANFSSILRHMTTTNAARDYQEVISWVRSNSTQQIVLYAGSYGTYLASRLLTLDNRAADAIILDGVVSGPNKFAQTDVNLNVTAAIFGAACDADPTCSSRMGPNSFATLTRVARDISILPCTAPFSSAGLTSASFRPMLHGLFASPATRALIFPLIKRIMRCNVDDQARLMAAVTALSAVGQAPVAPDPTLGGIFYSRPLHYLISLSEMMFPNGSVLTKDELDAISLTVPIASFDSGARARRWSEWSSLRYMPDEYSSRYPNSTVPALLLNGLYDVATAIPWARQAAQAFNRTNQRLIEVPEAGHITLLTSPIPGVPATCGALIIASFLNQEFWNVTTVDTSCLSIVEKTDYSASSGATLAVTSSLLGANDAWGVDAAPRPSPTSVAPRPSPTSFAPSAHSLSFVGLLIGMMSNFYLLYTQ